MREQNEPTQEQIIRYIVRRLLKTLNGVNNP